MCTANRANVLAYLLVVGLFDVRATWRNVASGLFLLTPHGT